MTDPALPSLGLPYKAELDAFLLWLQEVKPRVKTGAQWAVDNDVLLDGEHGIELDTLKWKLGDGVTDWNTLAYLGNGFEDHSADLTEYLKKLEAASLYSPVTHTHSVDVGGNLCPNGDFTASADNWDVSNKVGTPTITYETSPLDSGLAAKMVFAAAGNQQVWLAPVLVIPGDDVSGIQGTFLAHSTKPCTYVVELLTSNSLGQDPDYDAQAEILTLLIVVGVTTVANEDAPISWSAVLPADAVKARVGIRVKAGVGQTTPITAYLDSVAYTWAAGSASTLTPQAQGVVARISTNQLDIATATPTKLLLDSSDVDRGGYLDAANNQLVIPSQCSGYHTLHAEVPIEINGTLGRRIVLKKNTVEVKAGTARGLTSYQAIPSLDYSADLKNGDVLALYVEQDSGVPLDVLAAGLGVSIVRHDRQPQDDTTPPPPPPVAGFSVTPTSGNAPLAVTCTSTATGDISSRTYDFGDGEGPQPSRFHTYSGAYVGNITQTVYGPGGSDSMVQAVNIGGVVAGNAAVIKGHQQTSKTDGGTSVTAALPGGGGAPASNDLIVVWAIQRGTNPVLTTPAGYTALGALYVGTNAVARAWSKTAGASEAAPSVVSSSDNAMVAGTMVFTAGSWKTSDPWSVDWIAEGALAATYSYKQPTVVTTDNNALRINIAGHIYSVTAPVLTIPQGFTARGSQQNALKTSNGNHLSVLMASDVVPAAGDAGKAIWTTDTGTTWIGMQFAVSAANASAPISESQGRFAGDPGVGKIFTTWIQHSQAPDLYAEWKLQLGLIRNVSYPSGVIDTARDSGLFKWYNAGHPLDTPLSSRVGVIQDGRILMVTNNITLANAEDILAGNWDNRMDDDIVTLNQWRDLYNGVVWWNLLHEAEDKFTTKAERRTAREAQRYFVNYMRAGGVTNMAFIGPVHIADTIGKALYDFNNGAVQGHPWWEFDPNWRGPESGTNGYTGYTGWFMNGAGTEVIYNPVDFFTGDTKYADMAGCDLYCFHGQHGVGEANPAGLNMDGTFDDWEQFYWTSTGSNPANFIIGSNHMLSYEGHAPFDVDEYMPAWNNGAVLPGQQHGGSRYRDGLDRIYGTSAATRMPIFIAESAWPIHQTNPTMDPDWAVTFAHYQWMFQSLVNNAVVGLCQWKSDYPADVRQATIDSTTVSYVFGTKQAQKNPQWAGTPDELTTPAYPVYAFQAKYDPTDTRRKLAAWWLDNPMQMKKLRR